MRYGVPVFYCDSVCVILHVCMFFFICIPWDTYDYKLSEFIEFGYYNSLQVF